MPIRALHLLDSLNRGGAEMLCLDVCQNAPRYGLDLVFVATGGGELEEDFRRSAETFIRLQRKLPVDPVVIWKLRRIIRSSGIDVVHSQQAVEAIHAYFATRGTGAKCVMSLQNYILDEKNRIATKWIVPRMDAVCPVSNSMSEWFKNEEGIDLGRHSYVVHNAVDPDRLVSFRQPGSQTLRNEIGASPGDRLLGMVGNFYPDARKDQLTICRALPSIFESCPSAHFVFVGGVHAGAERYFNECVDMCSRNGVSEKVHFLGKRPDIREIVSELDLFVFSSVQEGLPVAAVEALMLGTPMAVSDIPPLLEVVGAAEEGGPCAAIFKTGDHQALSACVARLLENEDMRRALGAKGRADTLRRFGIRTHIERLKEVYAAIT